MAQFTWPLIIVATLTCSFFLAAVTGKFEQVDHYSNLDSKSQFDTLCALAPCRLSPGETLFFCSATCALALTSQRLLLWVKDGPGHRLVTLPINEFWAQPLDKSSTSYPIPRFITEHAGPKELVPLYIQTTSRAQPFESQIIALAQEDLPRFTFWYKHAQVLN